MPLLITTRGVQGRDQAWAEGRAGLAYHKARPSTADLVFPYVAQFFGPGLCTSLTEAKILAG